MPEVPIRDVWCVSVPVKWRGEGGEFNSSVPWECLTTCCVRHRLSSAYFSQSNGRAEVAVKQANRTLMANNGPNGSLNTDKLLKAMLAIRNKPDADS